jgi:hypothetical protein
VTYFSYKTQIQSNCALLTGGRCLEVLLFYIHEKRDQETVVVVGRWSLFRGGR